MLSHRLRATFVFLIALALVQAFILGAVLKRAADKAERFYVASALHNEYLSLGANKQRLKVWFAQTTLTGENDPERRALLLARMQASLDQLKSFAARSDAIEPTATSETPTIAVLAENFATLRGAIHSALVSPSPSADKAEVWRRMIEVFDRTDGRDMRTVLDEAIARQSARAETASRELNAGFGALNWISALLAVFVTLCCIGALAYFRRRIEQPFAQLVRGTEAIEKGDFAYRNPVEGSDEFSQIATRLNAAASALKASRERDEHIRIALDEAVAERTKALTASYERLSEIDQRRRQFFAEVSHELRTPITVIQGEAEIALRGGTKQASEYRESLQRVLETGKELSSRVEELLNLARSQLVASASKKARVDLREVCARAVSQARAIAAHRHIEIDFQSSDGGAISVWGDSERLRQALIVLLDNAVRYSPNGSAIAVRCAVRENEAVVSIIDQGVGLSDEAGARAFDRLYRSREAVALNPTGAGLGLSIAEMIVQDHMGEITLRNNTRDDVSASASASAGACATIALPLHRDELTGGSE